MAEPVPVTPVYGTPAPAPNNQYSDVVVPPAAQGHWMPASVYGVSLMAGGGAAAGPVGGADERHVVR